MTRRRAVESSSSWSAVDRAGLAFAWTVGLLFCAICAAIVIYVLFQAIACVDRLCAWMSTPSTASPNAAS